MKTISVVGAGFVGLAHAAMLAQHYQVRLIDRDERALNSIRSLQLATFTSDEKLVKKIEEAITNRRITTHTDIKALSTSDIVFISIGFDFSQRQSGYENLKKLISAISESRMAGSLIVFETTVPPKTCENTVLPVLSEKDPEVPFIYCYERVMPGPDYWSSLARLPRVFGSNCDAAAQLFKKHLATIAPGIDHVELQNLASAELAKVTENTYRMVNIALISEITTIGRELNCDVGSILSAIRSRSTHSNIRYPGLAPGGYCLTKDPSFLFESSKINNLELDFPIIKSAIDASLKMNAIAVNFTLSKINRTTPTVFLGLSYRSGVGDLRESSALEVALKLAQSMSGIVEYVDPMVDADELNIRLSSLNEITAKQAILAVPHLEFDLEFLLKFNLIIDINSCLNPSQVKALRDGDVEVHIFGEFL